MSTDTKPSNVVEALARVSEEVGAIEKLRTPGSGPKYDYRGIEDVLNSLHGPLKRNGVVIVPRVTNATVVDRPNYGKEGGLETQMTVEYRIYGPGGRDDYVDAAVFATGIDTGDKGAGKAMSYAYKALAFQLLCIPTDVVEDNEHDPLPRNGNAAQAEPKWDEARWAVIDKRIRALTPGERDRALAALVQVGLFEVNDKGKRFPVLPFTDAQLAQIDETLNAHEVALSDQAMEVLAQAWDCDDPLNPPEGFSLDPHVVALAEAEPDEIDWKAVAKAFDTKQTDLLAKAKSIARELGVDEPMRLDEILGDVATETRLWILANEPF